MLKKHNIKSYAFVFVLSLVIIFPANAIAQGNVVPQRNVVPQANAVPQRNVVPQASAVPPKQKLSVSAVLAKKIATLEGELSRTKTAFLTALNSGVEKDKKISTLTTSMQGLQGTLSQKDTELAALNEGIKGLQIVAAKRNTELVTLKDVHKKYKDVITCYKQALSEWDDHLRKRELSEQDRLSISTVLHAAIRECPPIQADAKLVIN
jgi:hypothetical protein